MRQGLWRIGLVLALAAASGFAGSPAFCQEGQGEPATLVILPPHVLTGDAKSQGHAELFCDRLAEQLEKTKGVAVLDRKAIDAVLDERALAGDRRPVLSYDVMVRVTAEAAASGGHLTVSVIDLSMGNEVASKRYGWGAILSESTLKSAAALCAQAAKEVAARPKDRVRARLPEAVVVDKVVRLYPLAEELHTRFEETLKRSPQVVMVQHLEANTAKEESLLLLMGMSRLPGGRRFAPQADVMVEIRLKETDAIGKTFEDTIIEVGCRVERHGKGDWHTKTGPVGDWGTLLRSVWEQAAKEIEGVDPKAGVDYLKEMQVRRRQAEAELKEFEPWDPDRLPPPSPEHDAQIRKMAKAAATAAKLDPTFERASRLSVLFQHFAARTWYPYRYALGTEVLVELRAYLKRFKTTPGGRERMYYLGVFPSLGRPAKDKPGYAEQVALIKEIIDLMLSEPIDAHQATMFDGVIPWISQSMQQTGYSEAASRQWRDETYDKARARLVAQVEVGLIRRYYLQVTYLDLTCEEVGFALAEKDKPRAARIVRELIAEGDPLGYTPSGGSAIVSARRLAPMVSGIGDADLTKAFLEWSHGRVVQAEVHPMDLDPPKYDADGADLPAALRMPAIPTKPAARNPEGLLVGVAGGKRYVVYGENIYRSRWPDNPSDPLGINATAAYVSLDGSGRAVGDRRDLPQPKLEDGFRPRCGAVLGRKVILGADEAGLAVFDTLTRKWTLYGAREGLPHLTSYRLVPVDDHTLFCVAGKGYGAAVTFLFDVENGKVTLIHRTATGGIGRHFWTTRSPWEHDGKVLAICDEGIIEDLLGRDTRFRPWPTKSIHGWPSHHESLAGSRYRLRGDIVEVGKHRFVMCDDGLREIDEGGNTVRAWAASYRCGCPVERVGFITHPASDAHAFGDLPGLPPALDDHEGLVRASLIGGDGRYLYLLTGGVVCYDPEEDTWYGPVNVGGPPATVPGRGGLLVGDTPLSASDIITAARRAKLVSTSAELPERFWRNVADASPFVRAQYAFGRREYDKAVKWLEGILAKDPHNGEALLLMALCHEPYALNDQAAFLKYCRLAAAESSPTVAVTGVYLEYLHDITAGQWADAAKIGDEMLKRFRIHSTMAEDIRKKNAELRKKAGK